METIPSNSTSPIPAVSIRNLEKVFPVHLRRRQVVALRGLSLDIPAGHVYGLLGPNGSGKSTTLKILLGLVTPSSGTSEIFGVPSHRVASRVDVGFLPENPYFYKFLTGAETIAFYGKLCGLTGGTLKARVTELLDLVGLEACGNDDVVDAEFLNVIEQITQYRPPFDVDQGLRDVLGERPQALAFAAAQDQGGNVIFHSSCL